MCRIIILFAVYIILPSNVVQVFILISNLLWENRASFNQLLCINLIVLRKIKIYITSNCMSISSISHITIFICKFIYDLIFQFFLEVILVILYFLRLRLIFIGKFFLSIFFIQRLLLHGLSFLFLILFFQFSDLLLMFLRKFMILFHYLIHIILIYLLNVNILSLF